MERRERYITTLGLACHVCGSREAFADFLAVAPEKLEIWLAGAAAPPVEAFMSALDVIAYGPTVAKRRRPRVAVIRPQEDETRGHETTN
jgi:DNA-binding transcriptional regulator YdaS (Cro superfamily)